MKILIILLLVVTTAFGQSKPSNEVLSLSLRTISKSLVGCREVYTHTALDSKTPSLKRILSDDNYKKDMLNLSRAEDFTNGLISHPEKISGQLLVALLSVLDDLSISTGSSRFEVLSAAIVQPPGAPKAPDLFLISESLNNCQKSIFNASDDYVTLVLKYVGDEDRKVAR